jgi:hypothetical protein
MKKHYYKIDVIGSNGYSFMVCTTETDMDKVLDLTAEKSLFQDADDINSCMVDKQVDDDDIKHFKDWDCLYELD